MYYDIELGGEIQHYLKTTTLQDAAVIKLINDSWNKDSEMWYGPNTCRTYSQDKFDQVKDLFNLQEGTAPDRVASSRDLFRSITGPTTMPASTTTSSTNSGPSR